jgi:uncharacterized protein (DUF1778 family)
MTSAQRIRTGRGEQKDERLEARVSAELKTMFQRAADLEGQTLSDFMIATLAAKARATIREHEIIVLAGRNRDVFMEALLNPPPVAPRLSAAFKRLKELRDDGGVRSGKSTGGNERATQAFAVRKRK